MGEKKKKMWINVLATLIVFVACTVAIIESTKTDFVDVIIDNETITGSYHFENDKFVEKIRGRGIITGAAVIDFRFRDYAYRVEIPTKAQVTKIELQDISPGDAYIPYTTKGFGSDTRLGRIKILKPGEE